MARPVKHNREIRRRIRVAVAAYAYEIANDPVMSDAQYDSLAREIDPDAPTNDAELDRFFMVHFDPDTGQWVHKHPHLGLLKHLYETIYRADVPQSWEDLI